ncbi:oxidoreductase domain-containing protein [Aspergillus neoniger CBS 115656]|uniref:Oxidoreductase domain-containing protein n=1 Tax=Aspergillus neoniger (strain CBS 115656) TaxID=1448310 RepID=A0A318YEA9_ASPNB|nr:oxidoreductase domain-containing protein [Aspergillus neoniger CBS 115656]PYH32449.1 oxidoreductase domain-containing protein [Aspergillus neoniger CBS 115656]
MTTTTTKTLFLTGGSGYIGSALIPLALSRNYTIRALSRTPQSDSKLLSLGVTPIRGDLTSLSTLRTESASATAVIHLATAFVFGQTPSYASIKDIDTAALDAIVSGLSTTPNPDGTPKPLVTTSGTLLVRPNADGSETDEYSPLDTHPLVSRNEITAHGLALGEKSNGRVRVMDIRLAPFVYGRGGSGIRLFMQMAKHAGKIITVGGGVNRTTTVHVDDAAELFLLAVEKGVQGGVYNAGDKTGVTVGEILGAVAEIMHVPVEDLGVEEAKEKLGDVVAGFLAAENRASGGRARSELGWMCRGEGVLEDIKGERGSYRGVVGEL